MPLSTGQILNDRYRIAKLLGEGGFGAVYRAWDMVFEVSCAIKENVETSPEAQRQFSREAQMLHNLRHPNLPQVKDYFQILGQGQYLVMDYIEGEDLQQLIDRTGSPLPEAKVLAWMEQICDAVGYLHAQEPAVIHRDIKPANIKITPQGNAVLVDFGIAKKFNPKSRTTVGARAVTPGYSPFEQYGKARTDNRTDIYSLGATMYALLTAQEPVDSIARMANTELQNPRQVNPAIDPRIEALILHAMEVMPEKRYQSLSDLKAELSKAAQLVQAKNISFSAGKTRKFALQTQLVSLSDWWLDCLKAVGAILIGIQTILLLDFYYGYEVDAHYFLLILAVYYLFFSSITLAGLTGRGRWRILPLLSGLVGALASILVLTIEHPTIWENTFIIDYPMPFLIQGAAILLIGILSLVQALHDKNWSLGILGIMSLLLSSIPLFIDSLSEVYLALPVAIPAFFGGALAFFAAVRAR